MPPPAIRILNPEDAALLNNVAAEVFDGPMRARLVAEFLADPRHHLAVAVVEDQVVGMASALHYVHPDKPQELWINELGVAPEHRGRGVGRQLMAALFERARSLGCNQAWVLTEEENLPARRLYASMGGKTRRVLMLDFDLAGSEDG